jgi:hypothetical protein
MPRLTPVFVAVLALPVLAAPVACAQDTAKGKKEVLVQAVCPNPDNAGGPVKITVNPWTAVLAQGDDTDWKFITNRPKYNTIRIEAKEASEWPYPDHELSGEDKVTFENMKADAQGDYLYNITIYCGEDKIVIDPRVRVGP